MLMLSIILMIFAPAALQRQASVTNSNSALHKLAAIAHRTVSIPIS